MKCVLSAECFVQRCNASARVAPRVSAQHLPQCHGTSAQLPWAPPRLPWWHQGFLRPSALLPWGSLSILMDALWVWVNQELSGESQCQTEEELVSIVPSLCFCPLPWKDHTSIFSQEPHPKVWRAAVQEAFLTAQPGPAQLPKPKL